MEKILRCSILIVDDFNNVLVAERGKGKGAIKTWGLFGKEIKGKEDEEKGNNDQCCFNCVLRNCFL